MDDPVKHHWPEYLKEIEAKLNLFKDTKESYGNDFDKYSYEMCSPVARFDRIIRSLEDYFELNKIRELDYAYVLHVKSDLQNIFMPATRASSMFNSIQKALRIFDPKAKLNLENVLRGSTVLCFNYAEENYFDEEFNREGLSEKFRGVCEMLIKPDDKGLEEITDILEGDIKKRNSLLSAIKNITPTPGELDESIKLETEFWDEPITFTQDIRKRINTINPVKKNNSRVDWNNHEAIGYVREINDVRKSFILFEDAESEDEGTKLIKLHYQEDSEKDFLIKHFKDKKIKINFSKESNKYILEKITDQA